MNDTPKAPTDEEDIGLIPPAPLLIHKQYLKDMSFEAPNSPSILVRATTKPEMEMNIMVDVQKLDHDELDNFYEVILTVNATTKRNDKTLFLVEIIYAATVSINGMDEKRHHPLLFIEVPQLIYPYLRQILANATQSGGFNALQLAPVDFKSMYMQRFAKDREAIKQDKT